MSERFEILSKIEKNLYANGSPIVVSAGTLLRDKKTDSIITQLKFQSVSNERIIALKIALRAFDISGKPVEAIDEYQYLDLDVHNGDFFGSDRAIVMPDKVTRIIRIDRITVVFNDGESEFPGEIFLPLENQERLDLSLTSELVKQYQIEASALGEYVPKALGELWLCSCQTPNATSICALCGAKKEAVFTAYNPERLKYNLRQRLAKQEEVAESRRKMVNKALAREKIERTKRKRIISIVAGCLIITLFAVAAINTLIDKNNHNRVIAEIDFAIESERYEQAFDMINNSDLSYDDKSVYREEVIPYMRALHEEVRSSSKENLALILDDTEYYINEDKIYSKTASDDVSILYKTSSHEDFLRYRWSVYANGCLFFVEGHESRDSNLLKSSYRYTAKYIDLQTGVVETLGSADSRGDVVKLDSGCIFIGLNILDFNEGIRYNPYNQSKYVGEDAVSDWELEDAIYMN